VWVEHIGEAHAVDRFSCGDKEMEDWLVRFALENDQNDLSRTYVLTEDGTEVIGYYTLAGMHAERATLPKNLRRGMPLLLQPGCLLARLAVAVQHQGQGYARDLVVDAIRIAVEAADLIGGRFMAVDPLNDRVRQMYLKWGFSQIPSDEDDRLYLSLDQARSTFGV
jgi:GNAT superfamily N-acetyltransferase